MTVSALEKPHCAVLLAAFNGMAYIQEQITSILQQQDVAITLFISVDASSDGTEAWLDAQAKKEKRIVLLPQGMYFGGAAKNFFRLIRDVDLSHFDYVSFADQDDVWHLDKLKRAVTVLQTQNYDAYSSNVMAFWVDGRQKLIDKAKPQKRWDFLFEAAGPGCTYVLNQKLMAAIKQRLLEQWDAAQQLSLHDWFFYAFARAQGYLWHIDPKPSIQYRQHEKNQVGINSGVKAYWNRFKKITNGWWLSQAALIADLAGLGKEPFVLRLIRLKQGDLLYLASKARHCRRQRLEQWLFCFFCLLLMVHRTLSLKKTDSQRII